jgi:pimeloyl-ACP methyl ester carboxylesterase
MAVLATPPARALYLNTEPDPVLGFFHAAAVGEERRETAVLVCGPFGWDDVCSYRGRMRWAEQLAADGHPALRIDLPGTGDSGGSPRDPGRVGAWTDAVAGAAAWLRMESGCPRVAVIGIGGGGLAAYLAAAAGAPIDDLVLWGVPARGRTLLRELRAFAALKAAEFPDPEAEDPPPLPEGYLEVAGYVISDDTARALEAVDLSEVALDDAPGRRALLLERDGVSADGRLRERLEASGVVVTTAPGPGYGAMVTNPQWAVTPTDVFATVAAWLADAPDSGMPPPASAPAASDSIELPGGVREAPLTIELESGRLFGILAMPAAGPAADFALVLSNAGAVRRIGPNRMWVEVARRWAARGVPTLRVDIEGLGDSEGDETRYAETAEMYASDLASQLSAAVDELERRGVASRFAAGGLCAGAFWSFHALRQDPRIQTALMLNLFSFFWDDELPAAHEVRRIRRLVRPSTWRRIVRGEVTGRQIRAILRWIVRTPIDLRARIARRRHHLDSVDQALQQLDRDDKRAVLLLGRGEPLVDRLRREGRLERLDRWPALELHQLPTRDHTFRALWLQQQVHEILDQAIEEELRRVGMPAPVTS